MDASLGEQRVANAVARRLVVAPHRAGGQAQFIEQPVPPSAEQGLDATRTWLVSNLTRAWTVEDMAKHARMSRRTFARRFQAESGTSPLQWLLPLGRINSRAESTAAVRAGHQGGSGT